MPISHNNWQLPYEIVQFLRICTLRMVAFEWANLHVIPLEKWKGQDFVCLPGMERFEELDQGLQSIAILRILETLDICLILR